MAISVNDERLIDGKQRSLEAIGELDCTGRSAVLLEVAESVLSESIDEYKTAIRREDLTDEVRNMLEDPQERAGEALVQFYYTLKREYAERRAKGEPLTERDEQVEEFLRNLSSAEYVSKPFPGALSALKRAAEFANENIPDDVRSVSDEALRRVRDARDRVEGQIEELGDRALQAYSDVEQAREEAKSNYLAVREITSAALRLEGRYDELNDVTPPVSKIMSPN
ncbi:MAG: hypothetical protein ABEL76_00225 [Bradymonadaceae bacterium]